MAAAGIACLAAVVLAGWAWTTLKAIAPLTQPTDVVAMIGGRPDQSLLARKTAAGERINVLLLGYGGPGQRGPYLTDSITVLSIDPKGRQAVVISLPRDLWVQIPALAAGQSVSARLNSAYAIGADRTDFPAVRDRWKGPTGGGELAAATVEQVTGLSIDYWISVDFRAFQTVVDALGGIVIDAPSALDDPCFPAHFPAGPQRLDGQRALIYARSRMTTSDFDRSRRQRLILLAIEQRLRSQNLLPRLLPLIGALQGNVLTDLRPAELRDLAHLVAGIDQADIRQIAVDDSNFLVEHPVGDGNILLTPRDPTYTSLRNYLANALPARAVVEARVPVLVEDGSASSSLPGTVTPAQVVAQLMRNIGINATAAPVTSPEVIAVTEIHSATDSRDAPTSEWLHAYLGGRSIEAAGSDHGITVVLGSDFTSSAFPPPVPWPTASSGPAPPCGA